MKFDEYWRGLPLPYRAQRSEMSDRVVWNASRANTVDEAVQYLMDNNAKELAQGLRWALEQ